MRSNKNQDWRRVASAMCLSAGCFFGASLPAFAQSGDWGTYAGASLGVPNFGDVGLKVFAGQQLHKYFGWEAGITRFAREVERTAAGDVKSDFWGLSGAAVGILQVTPEFAGFAKAGLMAGRKRVDTPSGNRNENELNLLVGLGARYAITPRAAIRAEYEEFSQGNLFSVGVSYKF